MKRLLLLWALGAAAGCGGGEGHVRTDEERADDQSIAAEVNRVMSRVEGVDRLRLRIDVVSGRVTLSGNVRSDEAAKAACEAAKKVKDVLEVVDRMEREAR